MASANNVQIRASRDAAREAAADGAGNRARDSANPVEAQRAPHRPSTMRSPHPLKILVAAPRGFCAGVERAIRIVELALKKYGAPVYVRHEIVHNPHVVESLKAKGAVFVEELDEIPETDAPVIFSAHGVPRSVPEHRSEERR